MTDPLETVRARRALGNTGEREPSPPPIVPGPFAPYPVWMGMTLLVRGAQLVFLGCCIWTFHALINSTGQPHGMHSIPPMWVWLVTLVLGATGHGDRRRYLTSPAGDTLGKMLASERCPACGQNVFDHRPPSGYSPETQAHAIFPSRICTNCGQDLSKRTAS
jgi:hypothetical protein